MLISGVYNKKRLITLLAVLAAIALIVVGFLYTTYFSIGDQESLLSIIDGRRGKENINTEFNKELFSSPRFKELKIHGKLPVEAGLKGQVNPFSPPASEEVE